MPTSPWTAAAAARSRPCPGDGVALALLTGAPIRIVASVLEAAGFDPADRQQQDLREELERLRRRLAKRAGPPPPSPIAPPPPRRPSRSASGSSNAPTRPCRSSRRSSRQGGCHQAIGTGYLRVVRPIDDRDGRSSGQWRGRGHRLGGGPAAQACRRQRDRGWGTKHRNWSEAWGRQGGVWDASV
jgi:hypothetical protein